MPKTIAGTGSAFWGRGRVELELDFYITMPFDFFHVLQMSFFINVSMLTITYAPEWG